MSLRSLFLIPALALLTPAASLAREPENLEAIQREARIVADVMRSAMRGELKDVRVTSVSAEYLPRQGVLVSVKMNAPWLQIDNNDATIQINGNNIDLEQIPSMVENILADLQIDVTPYEPEALTELRALRAEQRALRLEQRQIRSELRRQRRELVRIDDRAERQDAEDRIAELERELTAVDEQYDMLSADIDQQYDDIKDYRESTSPPPPPAPPGDSPWDQLVARNACDYGATLKTLSSENYLTIAMRQGDTNEYYAFKMDHVYDCSRGDMSSERLLELAYQYKG